jgi:hypothetical protein
VIVEEPARLPEGRVHRGDEVLVRPGVTGVAPDDQGGAGDDELHAHAEVLPEPLVTLRELDGHPAAADALVEPLELGRLLPHELVDGLDRVEVAPGDPDGNVHGILPSMGLPGESLRPPRTPGT